MESEAALARETRDGERSSSPVREARRTRSARRRSIRVARTSREERERALLRANELESESERPRARGECSAGPRPCPFVACKYHLYLDVSPTTGTIKLNFPELEVWELAESCALDVADGGGRGVDQASSLLNVTRERIRQIEALALSKLSNARAVAALRDEDAPRGTAGRGLKPRAL